jgi:hypothetical protein
MSARAYSSSHLPTSPQHSTRKSTMEPTFDSQADNGAVKKRYLCLTILAMRRPGTSHEDMRNHMTQISAPMTKGLMVKYGVKRWTQIHNTEATRALTTQLFDRQLPNVAAWDCFSRSKSVQSTVSRVDSEAHTNRVLRGPKPGTVDSG